MKKTKILVKTTHFSFCESDIINNEVLKIDNSERLLFLVIFFKISSPKFQLNHTGKVEIIFFRRGIGNVLFFMCFDFFLKVKVTVVE